jgi:hypothetical protein
MAVLKASDLISKLSEETMALTSLAEEQLVPLERAQLSWKAHPAKWNIAECLEHLNRYSRYYIPALEKALLNGQRPTRHPVYKSSWLGEIFVRSMLPGPSKTIRNKMKAPKAYNPLNAPLDPESVVQEFLRHQTAWHQVIEAMHEVDITTTKIPISISPWIRIRMGDVVRFNVAHTQRHWIQIETILKHDQFPR